MSESRDELEGYDQVHLEKVVLAVDILLRLAEESDAVPNAFEGDLWSLKDRVERALLLR